MSVSAPLLKRLIQKSPFSVRHIGDYIRRLWFFDVLQSLPFETIASILDAGCGGAQYALTLAAMYPHINVSAIDIKAPYLSESTPQNFSFRCLNILDLDDVNTFDFVYSIDVLEHIPHNQAAINRLAACLRPGGYLYIHMPGKDSSSNAIFPEKWFVNFQTWAKTEHIGETYSLPEMMKLLGQKGFTVLRAQHTFGPMGQLAWELDRLTDKAIILKVSIMPALKILARLNVGSGGRSGDFLILARKTDDDST